MSVSSETTTLKRNQLNSSASEPRSCMLADLEASLYLSCRCRLTRNFETVHATSPRLGCVAARVTSSLASLATDSLLAAACTLAPSTIVSKLGVKRWSDQDKYHVSYNIAPTQSQPVVYLEGGARCCRMMKWYARGVSRCE